jgi:hypothetical protein
MQLLQTNWKSQIDPLLKDPTNNGIILTGVKLLNGINVINHKLGRRQLGWMVTDIDAGTTVYRSAPLNDKTLTLTSGADCTISLMVF